MRGRGKTTWKGSCDRDMESGGLKLVETLDRRRIKELVKDIIIIIMIIIKPLYNTLDKFSYIHNTPI